MSVVALSFKVSKLQFLDRAIANHLSRTNKRFFVRAGGAVRKTAQRSLRPARQKKVSELTELERNRYDLRLSEFASGKYRTKPRRPEVTAKPGEPPVLHQKPSSMLRSRLFFGLDNSGQSVVIGPEKTPRNGSIERLESEFPFMSPAFDLIQPQFPAFYSQASR